MQENGAHMSTDFINIKKVDFGARTTFKGRPLVEQFPSLAFPVSSLPDWLPSILLRGCSLVNGLPQWWEMIFCENCNSFSLATFMCGILPSGHET